jgi:hypothetical protein
MLNLLTMPRAAYPLSDKRPFSNADMSLSVGSKSYTAARIAHSAKMRAHDDSGAGNATEA